MTSHSGSPAEPTRAGASCPGGPGLIAGRTVARVGYGAMQLRNLRHDRGAATALLRRAVELGVNHVDTAQFYGDGLVDGLIREAVAPDDGVTVVSKVGADPAPGGPYPIRMAQRPEELAATVDANLASLGLGQVPVVNLRRPDASTPVPVADDQVVDLDDQLAAMTALRNAGKIGAIGLSGVSLEELRRALPAGIACVQNDYSLISRGHEDMLQLCAGARHPLGSLLPAGRRSVRLPQGDRPGCPRRRRIPPLHPGASRPRLAAPPRTQHPGHPRHHQPRPPRGEPRPAHSPSTHPPSPCSTPSLPTHPPSCRSDPVLDDPGGRSPYLIWWVMLPTPGRSRSRVSPWPSQRLISMPLPAASAPMLEQLAGDELLAGGGVGQHVAEPEAGVGGVRPGDGFAVDGDRSP